MPAKVENGSELLPETVELATGANFAAIATVLPRGSIQNQMIWVHVEDGKLVLNTEVHRAKHLNVIRDAHATVLIRDEHDPYRYAEVRGRVSDTTTPATRPAPRSTGWPASTPVRITRPRPSRRSA